MLWCYHACVYNFSRDYQFFIQKVTVPSVESSILKIMLEYMYTGKCLFPRDDLNKAIEVCIN